MSIGNAHTKDVKRAQKESLLYKHLAPLINQISLDDTRVAGMTLNRVELSANKSLATLYFYSDKGIDDFKEKLGTLILYKPSLRAAIAKLVPARYTPELVFKFDSSFEKELKINLLLDKIKDEDE
jgi:ribosome-binding factor A